MSPNPYRAGNLFFGRQHERDEVGAQLRDGHSVLLIGGRQAGKTTLLANLGDLERGLYIYDAGRWTLDTERDALEELGRGLGAPCSTRLEVEAAMRARQPLCVAIDEADRVLRATWAARSSPGCARSTDRAASARGSRSSWPAVPSSSGTRIPTTAGRRS